MSKQKTICQEGNATDTLTHPVGIIPQSVTQHNKKQPAWATKPKKRVKTMDNGQWTMDNVVWCRFVGRGVS